ncbi:MAG TPA: tetratricopeptide repeat protein [Candidatus Polarisedimenticolia bacterium]|nr:tetratricopeptide repeat protein [Candidatus Polarisedimenticolia bacterium]
MFSACRSLCRPRRLVPAAGLIAVLLGAVPGVFAQGFGGTVSDILVRGDSLLAQGKANEAIVQFQEARTLCPTPGEMVQAYQGEARARVSLGELLPAAGLLEEAAAKYPEDPRVADLLSTAGNACQRAGEPDRAIDLMRRALEKNPTPDVQVSLKFHLAQALRLKGKPQEVVDLLKDFETTFPDNPLIANVLYTRAIAFHDLGRLDQAELGYREILKNHGRDRNAVGAYLESHFELAGVLGASGRRAEAVELYRKYVALNPSSPFAAAALERAGDLMLLRSPRTSAELYGLSRVKATANRTPEQPDMKSSRWLPAKRVVADALSRVWVVGILALAFLGVVALAARRLLRRLRKQPAVASL